MNYRLLLLGPPLLVRGSETVPLKSRKGQALLWYLAANPDKTFSREHLHGLLWDELPSNSARRDFNTMLSRLRAEAPLDCIRRTGTQLGWNPDAGFSTDIADFLRWTAGSEPHFGSPPPQLSLAPDAKEALRRAVALWRGPFLDGFTCDSAVYEEWMLTERHRWEVRMLAALHQLIAAERADARWDQVAAVARRGLELDPLQEPFYRAVMEALFRLGNRSAALTEFERCRRVLEEQLGTTPDEATMTLAETIRGPAYGAFGPAAPPAPPLNREYHAPPAPSAPVLRCMPPDTLTADPAAAPLVGRDAEYAQLLEAITRTARTGPNQMVLLVGEAGVGKTRLMAEVEDAAARGPLADVRFSTVLVGRGHESMASVPYAALAEALEPALAVLDDSGTNLPDVWLRELGRLLPDVFVHRPDLYPPLPMGSGDDQLRLFRAVARFLGRLPQPVLLVLDDLQWADPLTISLLDYLVRQPSGELRLAVVAAVRAGEDADALRRQALYSLEREGRLSRVVLGNLTREDTLALVRRLAPGQTSVDAGQVYTQTHGHPLYTVELVAVMRERTEGTGSEPLRVPPTMQNLVLSRLSRLGEAAYEVAETLAVFDRGATLAHLTRATRLAEVAVVAALDKLARAGITIETNQAVIDFGHDVFRDVVLDHMPPSRLSYRHRQAYAALVQDLAVDPADSAGQGSSLAPETDPHTLASLVTHATGGQLWEPALNWARQAAVAAERLYAFRLALDYLNTALHCLAQLPPTDVRLRERLELELQAVKLDRWSPAAERDQRLAAAARLARETGAVEYLPRIQMLQIESFILQGRCREALALLRKLEPLSSQDPRLAFALEVWHGAIQAVTGDIRQAIVHLTRVRDALEAGEVLKPGTSVHGGLASCYAAAGEFDKALACLEEMKREEEAQGYQSLTSKYLIVAATVEYWRGRWREAAGYAKEGWQIAREAEDPANETFAALWLGASVLEMSAAGTEGEDGLDISLSAATAALEAALAASERGQNYTRRDFVHAFLAVTYAYAGQLDKAHETVDAGLRLAEETGSKEGAALCLQAKGRIGALQGDIAAAERRLRAAADQFASLGHTAGARRCLEQLARLRDANVDLPSSSG